MPIHRPIDRTLRVLALWGVLPIAPAVAMAQDQPEAPQAASADASPAEAAVVRLLNTEQKLTPEELTALESEIDAALTIGPANTRWLLGKALAQRARGARAEAVVTIKRVVALQPEVAIHQFYLGTMLFESIGPNAGMEALSISQDARDALEKALKLDPSMAWARFAVCQFYIKAPGIAGGSYSKAKEHAKALLAMEAKQGEYLGHLILAMVAEDDESWKTMREQYTLAENATGIGASPTQALTAHAMALLRLKKDAKLAMPVLERLSMRQDADAVSVLYLQGEAKKLQEDWRGAADSFEQVLTLRPEAKSSRFAIAECYEKLGEKAKASEHYAIFAEKFPKDDRAEKAQSKAKKLRG
jgi:tetratricopeptide (TPR) repeat protein